MATRAAQETAILTPAQALDFIERHGVVCESAPRGAIPALAEAIAGESIRGNWWAHPKGRKIFALTRAVRDAAQVLVCRLIDGKISYVHERLWPALVRLADRFPRERLARVRETHTRSGKHLLEETPFPDWLPESIQKQASRLSDMDSAAQLKLLTESVRPARRRKAPTSKGP